MTEFLVPSFGLCVFIDLLVFFVGFLVGLGWADKQETKATLCSTGRVPAMASY